MIVVFLETQRWQIERTLGYVFIDVGVRAVFGTGLPGRIIISTLNLDWSTDFKPFIQFILHDFGEPKNTNMFFLRVNTRKLFDNSETNFFLFSWNTVQRSQAQWFIILVLRYVYSGYEIMIKIQFVFCLNIVKGQNLFNVIVQITKLK